jgi:hypothetical protein
MRQGSQPAQPHHLLGSYCLNLLLLSVPAANATAIGIVYKHHCCCCCWLLLL